MSRCQRCGYVEMGHNAADREHADRCHAPVIHTHCSDCKRAIVPADDDAGVCIECGGYSRLTDAAILSRYPDPKGK